MKALAAKKALKTEDSGPQSRKRKIVAVGDLHGDYYRLLRLLEAEQIIISDTLAWNPQADNIDLVLMGDYVDWRGEALEGDPESWTLGASRLLRFIFNLYQQVKRLKKSNPAFAGNFYPLLGNHDLMMLEALRIFSFFPPEQLKALLADPNFFYNPLEIILQSKLDKKVQQVFAEFLNWYIQGGEVTIASFGGLEEWKKELEGELGDFLRKKLKLGVRLGDWVFSHSLPDSREFYRPFSEILALPQEEKKQAVEEFVWGRGVWGYDYLNGGRTQPPKEEEFAELLFKMGAKVALVGHTPVHKNQPLEAYNGKLINLDLHGVPGSSPWTADWEP